MVMESCGLVQRVQGVYNENVGVIDVHRGRPNFIKLKVRSRTRRETNRQTYGQVPFTPITLRGNRPSGLAFST